MRVLSGGIEEQVELPLRDPRPQVGLSRQLISLSHPQTALDGQLVRALKTTDIRHCLAQISRGLKDRRGPSVKSQQLKMEMANVGIVGS